MRVRHFTAICAITAAGALAGCGPDASDTPRDTSMTGEEGGAAPAPTRSLADNTDDRTPPAQSPAGTPGAAATTGEAEDSVPAGSINMTEFAALDTDSNGMLAEQEWQNKPVAGIEFSDLDQDGSGNVDREEFRQAAAATGGETSEVDPESLDPTRSTTD